MVNKEGKTFSMCTLVIKLISYVYIIYEQCFPQIRKSLPINNFEKGYAPGNTYFMENCIMSDIICIQFLPDSYETCIIGLYYRCIGRVRKSVLINYCFAFDDSRGKRDIGISFPTTCFVFCWSYFNRNYLLWINHWHLLCSCITIRTYQYDDCYETLCPKWWFQNKIFCLSLFDRIYWW